MSELPSCPKCNSEFTYEMGALLVCPECTHDFDDKVDGFGAMNLKSSIVKKA